MNAARPHIFAPYPTNGTRVVKKRTRYRVGGALHQVFCSFVKTEEPKPIAGETRGFHHPDVPPSQFVLATGPTLAQCNANG